jgi:transposase
MHRLREGHKAERTALMNRIRGLLTEFGLVFDLDLQLKLCDERIAAHVRTDARASKAAALYGIGPVGASALVASAGDFVRSSPANASSAPG